MTATSTAAKAAQHATTKAQAEEPHVAAVRAYRERLAALLAR
jgi:hypothetical protein